MSQLPQPPPDDSGVAAAPEPRRSIWAELRDALRGTNVDYTKIPMRRAVFLLGVPMVLELVLESTFAVVDIFFVAKLGASAVATVGLTESYMFLIYSVGMGLAMAVGATVARRIGEGNRQQAAVTAVQAIVLAILVSVLPALFGIFYAQDLLRLMGADAWSIEHGYRYTQWMLATNAVILLLFVINAIFRGAGDAAIAMRVLWLANLLNILLCPLLIFGFGPVPALGIEGAAIATTIGRGVGVLYQFWVLFRGGKHIRVLRSHLALHSGILWNILRTSIGGIGQMLVATTSWIFLMRILASVGSEVVAGATIVIRIFMFMMMPSWGLSNAAATLVGQNLGAQQPARAEASVWHVGWYNMAYLSLVAIVFFIFPRQIAGFFSQDLAVVDTAAQWLRISSYSVLINGWWMVAVQAFNGSGDTATPMKINLFFFWLIQIPLAWLLAIGLGWQQSGVFWAAFVAQTTAGLFTLWLFTRGGWKTAAV